MFTSLIHLNQMKSQITIKGADQTVAVGPNLIYLKLWDLGTAYLKLSVLNELVQKFKTQPRILEALLKVMLVLSRSFEAQSAPADSDASSRDNEVSLVIMKTLLRIVDNTLVTERNQESEPIVKTALLDLLALQRVQPSITGELKRLVVEFNEKLRSEVLPLLFKEDQPKRSSLGQKAPLVNEEAMSFIHKYLVLMSHSSLPEACDQRFLMDMAAFGVQQFAACLMDSQREKRSLETLPRKSLQALYEVPHLLLA